MTQILFGTDTTPNLGDLDANFSELYSAVVLMGLPGYPRAVPFQFTSSGNGIGLGTTAEWSGHPSRITVSYAGASAMFGATFRSATTAPSTAAAFLVGGADNGSGAPTSVGSVIQSSTGVSYNTASDYRLKSGLLDLSGSGEFIDSLQPRTWTWPNGTTGVGFVAHEVAVVSPSSVVGAKDAVAPDGTPIYQSMEYGSAEFIAHIVAELKALRARVQSLEAAAA